MKQLFTQLTMLLTAASLSAQTSHDFPFESRFLSIDKMEMHYIDEGPDGTTILFLHGVPLSNYAWRNIIPGLKNEFRCIAPDFIGFGKSDQPADPLTFLQHIHMLEQFIDQLNLGKVTLVMTDIGGVIGNAYARMHPDRVERLVFFESPLPDARTFHKNGGMMQRMLFGMASKEKMGKRMLVKKNMMIRMLPMMVKRKVSREVKKRYAAPFKEQAKRVPLFTLPNAFPRKGKHPAPGDMGDLMNKNAEMLRSSTIPKLILYAKPGMLINKRNIAWAQANIPIVELKYIGKGKHLLEEDLPTEIANAILSWLKP